MEFTAQVVFWTAFFTMCFSQFLKMVTICYRGRKLTPGAFFEMAGMPSSHTAAITSAMLGIYFAQGFSILFAVALLTWIYMVTEVLIHNWSISRHAKIINEILPFLKEIGHKPSKHNPLFQKEMREDWGHTPLEIIGGFSLGLAITLIVYLL